MAHIYNINLPLAGNMGGGTDTSGDTVVPEVLEKGYTAHDKDGNPITGTLDTEAIRAEGVEAGKKSEYDAFWDNAQLDGNRTDYAWFLSSFGVLPDFMKKPKYPIIIKGGTTDFMRQYNTMWSRSQGGQDNSPTPPVDTSSWEIDTSEATVMNGFFLNASVSNLSFDASGATSLSQAFMNSHGNSRVNNITVKVSDKCIDFSYLCYAQYNLPYCTDVLGFAEGSVIAVNLNIAFTNQSKAQLISTVNALSSTTTGKSAKLRLDCVNDAFETSAGAKDGSTSEEWLALVATKSNWEIKLSNSYY